jgi:Tol biopolymer transport system component
MRRGSGPAVALALVWLVASCAGLRTREVPPERAGIDPTTAIALSVPGDAIYLIDPATGARAEVVGDLADFRAGYAAWAPDHARLAYANGGIYLLDFSRGRRWAAVRGSGLSGPAWNPRGNALVYGDGTSLWVKRLGPAPPVRLHVPATLAPLDPSWGTGGIAFEGLHRDCARSSLCPSTRWSELWTIRPDATDLRRLTRLGHVESPKWSPDGRRILFVRRDPDHPERTEVWEVGADGTAPHRLLPLRDVVAADWSPRGDRLAVVRRTGPERLRVWVGGADGSGLRPLGPPLPGPAATVDW